MLEIAFKLINDQNKHTCAKKLSHLKFGNNNKNNILS